MQTLSLLLSISLLLYAPTPKTDFLKDQKSNPRTRTAYENKEAYLKEKLKKQNLDLHNIQILINVYKYEGDMDIYVRKKGALHYKKFMTYKVCKKSGVPGPKRKKGDRQVPEGFYHIDRFNPGSNYYLSLGINYPNAADKLKTTAEDPGGDIFIHGDCVTLGCMPMTNEKMDEIYLLAIESRQGGQKRIPVNIFPFRFTPENITVFYKAHEKNAALLNFWNSLKPVYDAFHKEYRETQVKTDKKGNYYL